MELPFSTQTLATSFNKTHFFQRELQTFLKDSCMATALPIPDEAPVIQYDFLELLMVLIDLQSTALKV